MGGGYNVFVRGFIVNIKETIQNWGVEIQDGEDLLQFLQQTKGLKEGPANRKGKSFLFAVSRETYSVEDSPLGEILLFLAYDIFEFQYWVINQWNTKKELDTISEFFSHEDLSSDNIKSIKSDWGSIGLKIKSKKPSIFNCQTEQLECFYLP